MKTIRTINKEIEAKGFSILEKYSESRINSYFNFYQTHTKNTFIFREFVANQKASFIKSLTNKEFVLYLDNDEIRAYRSFEDLDLKEFFYFVVTRTDENLADYDKYLNEYIITF